MELPKEVAIPTEVMIEHNDGDVTAVADYLSDTYGFCVSSLNIEDNIAKDIVWDESD